MRQNKSSSNRKLFRQSGRITLIFAAVFLGLTGAVAQEKCFKDAKDEITKWIEANDDELIAFANQMDNTRKEGKDPAQVWIKYNGMEMPLSVAYQLVHAKYGKSSRAAVEQSVEKSRACAKDVQLPRAAYDVAREYFGLTTVLPEAATRVDFAEIKAGNIFGGSDALVPKALEDARKATEKALEDARNATGKALEDARKALEKGLGDAARAADPRNWKL